MDSKTTLLLIAIVVGALAFYILFADRRSDIEKISEKFDKAVPSTSFSFLKS